MSKILVIEDEQNIREILAEILELAGYDVITADNGKTGYDAILGEKPDLVLCDVNMPDLSGFDLLSALNQKLENKIIPPFLFLTALIEPESIRTGLNLGADDYITKPFDHKEILSIVKLRLEKRKKIVGLKQDETGSKAVNFSKLSIPSDEGLIIVSFDDIICCQADRAYCYFVLKNGTKVTVTKPMKDFETRLLAHNFFKIHKSTIVNLDYTVKYLNGKGGQLQMADGNLVSVSVRKKKELLEILKSSQ